MKRFWIGLVILMIILLLSTVMTVVMPRVHLPISQQLSDASQAAQTENWAQAETLAMEALSRWEAFRGFTAAMADHAPMEQIDSGFAQINAFLQRRDPNEFSAACATLARLVQAMADSQTFTWWNFL